MSAAPLKHQDKLAELVALAPAPDVESEMPDPNLGPVVAARLETWCRVYGLPPSTLRMIIAQGQGPPRFASAS